MGHCVYMASYLAVIRTLLSLGVIVSQADDVVFDDIVSSDEVHLVEFYHPKCGTCAQFGPIFAALAEQMRNSMPVRKVSVETRRGEKVAEEIGVAEEGIPNVRLFHLTGDRRGTKIMADEDPLPDVAALKERIDSILAGRSNLRGAHILKIAGGRDL